MAVLCLVVSTKEGVMNENEFDYGGKHYEAIPSNGALCNGCQMNSARLCSTAPSCSAATRLDGRDVIFVEKQQ